MLRNRIIFVTSNKHKYMEALPIARRYGFELEQYSGLKFEIQSDDLLEIAKFAALNSYMLLQKPVLVEDAGLYVVDLNGFPGPYSSYVYRTIGCEGVLKLMEKAVDRRAFFRSAAVLIHEPYIITHVAEVHGYIAEKPRGDKGFGFDPIFIPEGSDKTFGEMDVDEKNKYSHRARSVDHVFRELETKLFKGY